MVIRNMAIKPVIVAIFILSPILLYADAASPIQMSVKDYVDSEINSLDEKIEAEYDAGLSAVNQYITILLTVIGIIGSVGFFNVFQLNKKFSSKLTELDSINKTFWKKNEDLEASFTKLESLQKSVETVKENCVIILNEIISIYNTDLDEQDIDFDKGIPMDTRVKIKREIGFIEKFAQNLSEHQIYLKAASFFFEQQYDESIELLELLISNFSENPKYYYQLGIIHQEKGAFEAAKSYYNHTVKIDPEYYSAYINKAIILKIEDKLQEAVKTLSSAITTDPENIIGWNNLLSILIDTDDVKAARMALEQAERLDPENMDILYNKACLLIKEGNNDDAYESIELLANVDYYRNQMAFDEAFEPIRTKPKYLEIIKKHSQNDSERPIPQE